MDSIDEIRDPDLYWDLTYTEFLSLVALVNPKVSAVEMTGGTDLADVDIRQCFGTHRFAAAQTIEKLQRELTIRHEVYGDQLDPHLTILLTLSEALKKGDLVENTQRKCDWKDAIEFGIKNPAAWLSLAPTDTKIKWRHRALGVAAKEIVKQGYELEITSEGPLLTSETESKIWTDIDTLAQAIGGSTIVASVLLNIEAIYDIQQERFQITRNLTPSKADEIKTPWSYLLQLGTKYGPSLVSEGEAREKCIRLIRLCTAACALEDLQNFSIFEVLLAGTAPGSVVNFLENAVQFDSVYVPRQLRARDAIDMCEGIFSPRIDDLSSKANTIRTAIALTKTILSSAPQGRPYVFTRTEIAERSGLEVTISDQVLNDILVHNGSPNTDLRFPPMANAMDFGKRPLIAVSPIHCCLIERSICAESFLDAIFAAETPNIGKNLERYLVSLFTKKGLKVKSGKYSVPKTSDDSAANSDCDVVIETDSHIFFLELKSKSFTRDSRSGVAQTMLMDLTNSLLSAQKQAMEHELRLYKFGKLELTAEDGKESTLIWNNRIVERLAISAEDFGCLHERSIFDKFLELSTLTEVVVVGTDVQDVSRAKKLNHTLNRFRYLGEVIQQRLNAKKRYWNSWFFSIPQLSVMMDNIKSNSDFEKEILRLQSVVFGQFDFYAEYAASRKLLP